MDIVIFQVNGEIRQRVGIHILDLHAHLTTCQLLTEDGGLLQSIDDSVGIDAALETETRIGAQAMPTGTLTDPGRMEIGRL